MQIRKFITLAAITGCMLFSQLVSAQTVGIGTTKGGATAQIAAAIAKVVSANAKVQVRPQAMANTQQYIPFVNGGKIELGLANVPQTRYSVSGTGMSEGKPNPNLRMLVTLFPFRTSLLVAGDSGINSFADLKGKKLPAFPERALGDYLISACLKAGGLSYDDVEKVPASNFPKMWKMFKEGQIDAAIVAAGSKPAYDFEASFGSVQFLSLGKDQQAIISEFLPGSFLAEMTEAKTPGLSTGMHLIGFDYALFANKDVADDIVTEVVRAMHDNPDQLKATSPLWKGFDPANMAKDVGVEFHPAAITFYKEKGIWQR